MHLVITILNKLESLQDIVGGFRELGLGSTVLESRGFGHSSLRTLDDFRIATVISALFETRSERSITILTLVKDEEQVKAVTEVVSRAVGDIEKPETAILFSLEVKSLIGLSS